MIELDVEYESDSLVLVLDGVSKDNFDFFYRNEYLPNLQNYFAGRSTGTVISEFPSLTGASHCGFLGLEEPSGYEASRFLRSKNRMHNTYPRNIILRDILGIETPSSIAGQYDFHKGTLRHVFAFMNPEASARADSHKLRRHVSKFKHDHNSVWILSTDELTHRNGRAGLGYALKEFDAVFMDVVKHLRPKELLIFSDHGNHTTDERLERSYLEDTVQDAGFTLSRTIRNERDVVLPSFGMISFAALYTNSSNIPELSDVLLENKKVDFIAYVNKDHNITVEAVRGKAHVECKVDMLDMEARKVPLKFRYEVVNGQDPLGYQTIIAGLLDEGYGDEQGFVAEKSLFATTMNHKYPNALRRLHGAFFQNGSPGDILVSLRNGYYNGRKNLEKLVDVYSTHGNLTREASTGFSLYTGPQELPSSSMIYELNSFSKEPNPIKRGLRALYQKITDSFKRK